MVRGSLTAVVVCLLCLAATGSTRVVAARQLRPEGPRVASAGQLIISEFRLRGPSGAADEFIEIENVSGSSHTVSAASGTGYGVAASDGTTRCSIPNGTVIPSHGHYLCVNSTSYSLTSYPAGNGTTANGDASYTTDIADNAGIAIFNNNSGGGSYSLANRLDAAGSTSEANTTYKEGAGYPPLTGFNIDYSWVRKSPGFCPGSTCGVQATPAYSSAPTDTDNNANDFYFSDTNGSSIGGGQRLGAPGPQNLSGPIMLDGTSQLVAHKVSGCDSRDEEPNRVRDVTSDPPNNSTFGTLDLRTTWKNDGPLSLTRLRFRIIDVSTFPAASTYADLRPRTSGPVVVSADAFPCGIGASSVTVQGTTLEQPPSQPNGAGFNGSLSVATITLGTPLAAGSSVSVRFLLGIQQTGTARFCVIPETLPAVVGDPWCYIGTTETPAVPGAGDYDNDQKAEMPMYNPATGQWKILKSSGGFASETVISWGGGGYEPVPGDYDGDGRVDAAVYLRSTGVWSVLTSTSNYTRAFNVTYGGPGFIPMPADYDGDGTADISVNGPSFFVWGFLASSTNFVSGTVTGWAAPGDTPVGGGDYDGDGAADMALYKENTGEWLLLFSSGGGLIKSWGGHGYTPVPGDYDGDGRADLALYNRTTGAWNILKSAGGYTSALTVNWGGPGFVPVPGDYDGDRRIDVAVYQASATKWMALKSTTSYTTVLQATYGTASDVPMSTAVVPASTQAEHGGDFDGDFTSDVTVYNTTSGVWSTLTSTSNFVSATNRGWGGTGYTQAPGDYDGDGMADLGLYEPATGHWLVLRSGFGAFSTTYSFFAGGPGYIPVAGDYDGDGRTDMVVYNPSTGLWYGLKSSSTFTTTLSVSWGGSGYTATPGDFDADGALDLGLYQASTGNWFILKSSTGYTTSLTRNFGGSGYAPVAGDFDGDGITDFAVYQTATGIWTMLKSSSGNVLGFTVSYGGAGYTPVAGDWDGDGHADVGVYNTATGDWSILLSRGNYTTSLNRNWGGVGYMPVPQFP